MASIGAKSVTEGLNLNFSVSASDPDNTIPTLTTTALPAGAVFTDNGNGSGSFDWTPNFIQSGSYSVTFFANDGISADSEIVTITVNEAGNQSPVLATIGPKTVLEGANLNFGISASDADSTAPALSTSALPTGATFVDNGNGTGTFDWTPAFTQSGSYFVFFYASDTLASDSEIVSITVNEAGNQLPVLAIIGSQSTTEGINLNFGVSAVDPDSTTPSLSTSTLPANATFTDNGNGTGSFSWTPGFDQAGIYNITFFASDGAAKDSEIVTVTIGDGGSIGTNAEILLQTTIGTNANIGNYVKLGENVDVGNDVFIDSHSSSGTVVEIKENTVVGNDVRIQNDVTNIERDVTIEAGALVTSNVNVAGSTVINAAPTIALIGANPQILALNDPYVELTATCTDPEEGSLPNATPDTSAVVVSVPGSYPVTYDCQDSYGNIATTVTRTVQVGITSSNLTIMSGTDSENGVLLGGDLLKVQTSDGDRYETSNTHNTVYGFSSASIPGGATITSVIIYVEHHEEASFVGTIQWTTEGSSTASPIHLDVGNEAEDSWDVFNAGIITTPDKANSLQLQITNNDGAGAKTKTNLLRAVVQWFEP